MKQNIMAAFMKNTSNFNKLLFIMHNYYYILCSYLRFMKNSKSRMLRKKNWTLIDFKKQFKYSDDGPVLRSDKI